MPFCRIEAGLLLKRVVFRTDEVIVLEDPGQPAGDHRNPAHDSSRRCASAEDETAYGSHPGLRPGLEHVPIGRGRLSALLASVAVPTTRCVNRQRCACESSMTFDEQRPEHGRPATSDASGWRFALGGMGPGAFRKGRRAPGSRLCRCPAGVVSSGALRGLRLGPGSCTQLERFADCLNSLTRHAAPTPTPGRAA